MSLFLIKIILAVVLGAIIGAQRSYAHKQAGLRTFALVSLGSCVFVLFVQLFSSNPEIISRTIANVLVGIGFLGGGVIFFHKDKVFGLTTAAALWCTAAIGLGIGLGLFKESIIVSLAVFIILQFFSFLENLIKKTKIKNV